jgi:CMP/dCMP kinase
VIAIDGPAGAGKSTVGKALARRLGLRYLDTGAQFRAVGVTALARGVELDDAPALGLLASGIELVVDESGVEVDGRDVTAEIRTPAASMASSKVAVVPAVRADLIRRQRDWADANNGGVVEGRDIGTVVFPDAELKLYITASPETRAERRSIDTGEPAHEVLAAIVERDLRDTSRDMAPLSQHDEAILVDTTGRTVEEIVDSIVALLFDGGRP